MDGTSGVYWSIKPNILKGHVWFLPKPNEFLQILYWKSGEFVLAIGGICTGNRDRIHWKFGAWFAFCKKKPPAVAGASQRPLPWPGRRLGERANTGPTASCSASYDMFSVYFSNDFSRCLSSFSAALRAAFWAFSRAFCSFFWAFSSALSCLERSR